MRKICSSRLFRILVCLVLICCFLVNLSPLKARALEPVSATIVTVSASLAIAAALICLGVGPDNPVDNGAAFNSVCASVNSFLYDAGLVLQNGSVEMLRVVNELGVASFLVANEFLEGIRGWLFDNPSGNSVLSAEEVPVISFSTSHTVTYWAGVETFTLNYPFVPIVLAEPNTGNPAVTNAYSCQL